jgi:hypothetical protein
VSARRLPGISIESRPPKLAEVLPRMDVALFVGFAASGPLHVPVPVDDARAFAQVFGADLELAWDEERGEARNASLGPCVRSFFQNGGRRCWVIRVARTSESAPEADDQARSNVFPVPGLMRVSGQSIEPAFAQARSEGSWSDSLAVGAAVELQPLTSRGFAFDGARAVSVALDQPDAVTPGDVLCFDFDAGPATLFANVVARDGAVASFGDVQVWLLREPPAGAGFSASWFPTPGAPAALPAVEPSFADDGTAILSFAAVTPELEGAFLLLSRGSEQVWFAADESRTELTGSPPAAATVVSGRWFRASFAPPAVPQKGPVSVERVRVQLAVKTGVGNPQRLRDLGLSPGHPRFYGALPSDVRLFETSEDLLTADELALRDAVRAISGDGIDLGPYHQALFKDAATPRFPLASGDGRASTFLPFGMQLVAQAFLGPAPVSGDPAQRNGLSRFDAQLFLDPALADASSEGLRSEADFIRWQQPMPRRLQGIHAGLSVDEATLVAVPDAAQRGWSLQDAVLREPPDTPSLTATADPAGKWTLHWTTVDASARYALQTASSSEFTAAQAVALPSPAALDYAVPAGTPDGTWFRVRAFLPQAEDDAAFSFWSDPVRIFMPAPQFEDCNPDRLAAPKASLADPPDLNGTYRLAWTAVPNALAYEVQEAASLDFSDPATVYRGKDTEATVYGRAPGRYHCRVRATGADPALASRFGNGVAVTVPSPPRRILDSAGGASKDAVLTVQAALLRMCAARGDLLAALSLPDHFREDDAAQHAEKLRVLTAEGTPWSYGALYHPWLVVESDAGPLRVPPDGAACGVMAARAISRGAWIAPANLPLADALGLVPAIAREQRGRLLQAHVNLVRDDPRGFVFQSADTIATDEDLLPINVRRLLILLRRAAQRLGPSFVFEPNDRGFRRTVEREFGALLDVLQRGGAFAGATATQSYQVLVESQSSDADAGRFVVDLMVAPSLPLEFLTVRLVQSGADAQVTEVA